MVEYQKCKIPLFAKIVNLSEILTEYFAGAQCVRYVHGTSQNSRSGRRANQSLHSGNVQASGRFRSVYQFSWLVLANFVSYTIQFFFTGVRIFLSLV